MKQVLFCDTYRRRAIELCVLSSEIRRNTEAIDFHFPNIYWVVRRCQISEMFSLGLASFVDLDQIFLFFVTISV